MLASVLHSRFRSAGVEQSSAANHEADGQSVSFAGRTFLHHRMGQDASGQALATTTMLSSDDVSRHLLALEQGNSADPAAIAALGAEVRALRAERGFLMRTMKEVCFALLSLARMPTRNHTDHAQSMVGLTAHYSIVTFHLIVCHRFTGSGAATIDCSVGRGARIGRPLFSTTGSAEPACSRTPGSRQSHSELRC